MSIHPEPARRAARCFQRGFSAGDWEPKERAVQANERTQPNPPHTVRTEAEVPRIDEPAPPTKPLFVVDRAWLYAPDFPVA